MRILAADIGGTNSRFAVFELERSAVSDLQFVTELWLETASFSSFESLLKNVRRSGMSAVLDGLDTVVVAAAGPVVSGIRCTPPNIDWVIERRTIELLFPGSRAMLLNDFAAQAYACISPCGRGAKTILPGVPGPSGSLAVIGAGTGLGKAALLWQGDGEYTVVPSEGGHASFPAEREEEWELLEFIRRRVGGNYPTCEDLVSGGGLSHLHAFFYKEEVTPEVAALKLLGEAKSLEYAARFLGRVCRNFALEVYAYGGVFVAGGVAAKNPAILEHPAFSEAFWDSVVYSELLRRIPLYLLDDPRSGLWGAAYFGASKVSA